MVTGSTGASACMHREVRLAAFVAGTEVRASETVAEGGRRWRAEKGAGARDVGRADRVTGRVEREGALGWRAVENKG